jgi:Co/Zn/Cd efflux system component
VRRSTKLLLAVLVIGLAALVLGWTGVLSDPVPSTIIAVCLLVSVLMNIREAALRGRRRSE